MNHHHYSPNLAPLDFHSFTKLKGFLGEKRFYNDDEIKQTLLKELTGEVYNTGIQKPVPRQQKCIELDSDYVEE